jgi:hypothetical protein
VMNINMKTKQKYSKRNQTAKHMYDKMINDFM